MQNEIVGVIPAAGFAKRISPLPCSKEIYPVGFSGSEQQEDSRPRVISSYLLESMQAAGIEKTFMIIREGKWDIPAYFCKQNMLDMQFAYVVTGITESTAHTTDHAYPFVKDNIVAFGFPDILIKPQNVFQKLLKKQQGEDADVVLGLFKVDDYRKVDMVEIDEKNRVKNIIIKPQKTELTFTWMMAVWTPVFTSFMHNMLTEDLNNPNRRRELYMGDIVQRAIDTGLNVCSVTFPNGRYLDIGTPDDLRRAVEINGGS